MGTSTGYIGGMVVCIIVPCAYVVVTILVGMWSHIYRAFTEEQGRQ